MPEYRRLKLHGGSYFFTVVTYARKPIFNNPLARDFLHAAWVNTCERFPFITEAVCLLPDHIHCIWTLLENDANYSVRWKEIKRLLRANMPGKSTPAKNATIHAFGAVRQPSGRGASGNTCCGMIPIFTTT